MICSSSAEDPQTKYSSDSSWLPALVTTERFSPGQALLRCRRSGAQPLFSDATIRRSIRGQTKISSVPEAQVFPLAELLAEPFGLPPYFQSDWKWPFPLSTRSVTQSRSPALSAVQSRSDKFTPQTVPRSQVGQPLALYKVTTCSVNDVGGRTNNCKRTSVPMNNTSDIPAAQASFFFGSVIFRSGTSEKVSQDRPSCYVEEQRGSRRFIPNSSGSGMTSSGHLSFFFFLAANSASLV